MSQAIIGWLRSPLAAPFLNSAAPFQLLPRATPVLHQPAIRNCFGSFFIGGRIMSSFDRALIAFFCMASLLVSVPTLAEKTAEELARESEAACIASASVKPTPEMIVDKVDKACALLQKEGLAAFPKFKGADSEFIFAGTYIWIHDLEGVMRVHPIVFKLEGKPILHLKDSRGKLFFYEMNEIAKNKGSGWVDYTWPRPGEKNSSPKISYVKLVKVGGEQLVVGCGTYDLTPEVMQKLTK
jgi:cytochrome c